MTAKSTAFGQGKLIIFGEHAVVYGHPAVACSLPRGARATLSRSPSPQWSITGPRGPLELNDDIRRAGRALLDIFELRPEELRIDVELSIPIGVGLGSSAALAVALARGASDLLGLRDDRAQSRVDVAVAAAEEVFHGTPSGIDQQAAMGGGFFSFRRDQNTAQVEPLDVPRTHWLVARVGPSKSTASMVQSVAARRDRQRRIADSIFQNFAAIADAGRAALQSGDWDTVGELMDINQGLLNAIGVSTPELESACDAARNAGALGAKLTGSGGGGCIVVLAGDEVAAIEKALTARGDLYTYLLPDTQDPS